MSNTGGPAFPTGTGVTPYNPGMTLRDYFAAKAMLGLLANGESGMQTFSQAAYTIADAMLRAREQK